MLLKTIHRYFASLSIVALVSILSEAKYLENKEEREACHPERSEGT
jgi:hypothetical protein